MQPTSLGRRSDVAERPAETPETSTPADVGCLATAGYYMLLFFAYWFGAGRFDYDHDGHFDPADVALFLEDMGVVTNNFKKKKRQNGNRSGIAANKSSEIGANEEFVAAKAGTPSTTLSDDPWRDPTPMAEDYVADKVNQHIPFFIILQTFIVLMAWLVGSIYRSVNESDATFWTSKAGLDTISPGWSDLRLFGDACQDLRAEVWRYITYQWSHVGISHVLVNCFMLIVLGIPLEGLHGFRRITLMFNAGVLGGACCYWVGDASNTVVGMSGGCYALVGMHAASLIMNWSQIKFRWACLVFLALLISIDVAAYVLSVGETNASHTAHVGGAIAGFLIDLVIGKNLKILCRERYLQAFAAFFIVVLLVFCFTWLAVQDPPKNMFADYSWCWLRQMYYPSRFGNKWQCVQCANKACIETYSNVPSNLILTVTLSKCLDVYFEGTYHQI